MMKLGEAMVRGSLITRDQLRQALERQVIFGGRLGTNILELGFIKEDDMLSFLGTYFRVPAAKPSDLNDIGADVIACISSELADKYKVLPFKKDRNRLHVAMLDPREIASIDEMRFLTGSDIIPFIVTDLRLLYCLEKYYGIMRDLRYISVLGKEESAEQKKPQDLKEQVLKVKEQFAGVRDRDEVIGILLNETKPMASRAAVFLVKGNVVNGWKSRNIPIDGFEAPLDSLSIFSEVISRKSYYRGPLLKVPGNEPLIQRLKGAPQDCCMIPIQIREKIVGLLYVDNGTTAVLDAGIGYVNNLAAMAAVSFELVILRKKLFDL